MEQKQILGKLLFPLAKSMVHNQLASMITGMLLENNVSQLLQMLENHDSLKSYVDQAVPVLRAHVVCIMLYVCDFKKQLPSVSFTLIRVNI